MIGGNGDFINVIDDFTARTGSLLPQLSPRFIPARQRLLIARPRVRTLPGAESGHEYSLDLETVVFYSC
jgi:hypothetical protein